VPRLRASGPGSRCSSPVARNFRHANSLPLPDNSPAPQKVLAIDEGPGWVDLWSPDAIVRWRVEGTEDLVNESIYLETGPASKGRAWLGRLGSSVYVHSIVETFNNLRSVNPATGEILVVTAEQRAQAVARFYPADIARCDPCDGRALESFQFSPLVGSGTTTIPVVIPGGATVDIGFPPEERFSLTVLSPVAVAVTVSSTVAGKTVLYTSAAAIRHSLNVSPWHFLSVVAPPGPAIPIQILWRDLGSVTNA